MFLFYLFGICPKKWTQTHPNINRRYLIVFHNLNEIHFCRSKKAGMLSMKNNHCENSIKSEISHENLLKLTDVNIFLMGLDKFSFGLYLYFWMITIKTTYDELFSNAEKQLFQATLTVLQNQFHGRIFCLLSGIHYHRILLWLDLLLKSKSKLIPTQ